MTNTDESKKAPEDSVLDDAQENLDENAPESKKGSFQFFWEMTGKVIPVIFITIFVSFLTNSFLLGDKYVEKAAVKKEITTLVNNGAGLRAVKFHYDHRTTIKRDILFTIKTDLNLYYPYEIALSEVLEQLRTDQYLDGTPDIEFLDKLDLIIREYTESNPFDKLESGQKDLFENIRVKLNGNYSTVEDDVNKLSNELSNKNKLVNEYLSDSQTSLVVSIVSAFIAVFLAGVQMWQTRSSRRSFPRQSFAPEYIMRDKNSIKRRREVRDDGSIIETTYHKDGSIINRRVIKS